MARIRLAIDGCGVLTSSTILPHLVQPDIQARAEIVAVADILPERARAAADTFGVPHVFQDYETMLREAEIDAVLIITPGHLHVPHAELALRSGRHVYVQKPTATSVEDAARLVQVVEETGLKAVCAPGQILWPLYHQIREVIQDGEIGPVYMAQPPMLGWGGKEVHFDSNPKWFFSPTGGPMHDHGGYGINTLVTLLGAVQRVTALSGRRVAERIWRGEPFEVTGHDNTVGLLDFGNAVFGMLPDAWCERAPANFRLKIQGLWGAIETHADTANDLSICPWGFTVYRSGKPNLEIRVNLDEVANIVEHERFGHVHVYQDIWHLLDCIERDEKPLADVYHGQHMVEVMEACFRAAATGQTQDIPYIPTAV